MQRGTEPVTGAAQIDRRSRWPALVAWSLWVLRWLAWAAAVAGMAALVVAALAPTGNQLLLGRDRSLVVAAATLAVAVAFQPARRRIQEAVDRRFNRRRYDASQTIQAFARRLRQQVDLDALRGELLAVVDQTMQPSHAALWLRQGRR